MFQWELRTGTPNDNGRLSAEPCGQIRRSWSELPSFFVMLNWEKYEPVCSCLVSFSGTTYGDRMTRLDFLRPQRKWLTDNLAILLVGLLLTTGVWFCFEPPVFALMQGLLLVFVLSGCFSHSSRGSSASQNISLLELPFMLARDLDTFARYQSISQSLARISRALDPIYRELALE